MPVISRRSKARIRKMKNPDPNSSSLSLRLELKISGEGELNHVPNGIAIHMSTKRAGSSTWILAIHRAAGMRMKTALLINIFRTIGIIWAVHMK